MYVFVFDRRSFTMLTLTAVIVAAALFASGLLSGLYFDLPQPATETASTSSSSSTSTTKASSRPRPSTPPAKPTTDAAAGSEPPAPSDAAPPAGAESDVSTGPEAEADSGAEAPPESEPETDAATELETLLAPEAEPAPETLPLPTAHPATALLTAPPPPALPALARSAAHPRYAVQAAAFAVEANARREAEALRQAGYEAAVMPPAGDGSATLYLVLLGSFTDRDDAEALAARFERQENRNVWVREM